MATYAIGDLQGCDREFSQLLEQIAFGASDTLWLVGDLVNRGPDSLAALRRVYALREQTHVVLGNHDLHLLAIYFGGHRPGRSDTFDDILQAPDADELCHWLRQQPLVRYDQATDYCLVHAGIPHVWSVPEALSLAKEVEAVLAGDDYKKYLANLYGNEPDQWRADLSGQPRLKCITNYFTRMRLVDHAGRLNFAHKGALESAPSGWTPWYQLTSPRIDATRIVFGHWAALDGQIDVDNCIALDTGCVWGRQLTAYCLETQAFSRVSARS